jgi:hypothetical protein
MTAQEEQRYEAFRIAISQPGVTRDECRILLDAYAGPGGWDCEYVQVEGIPLACNVKLRFGDGKYVTRAAVAIEQVLAGMMTDDPFVAAVKMFGYPANMLVQDTDAPEKVVTHDPIPPPETIPPIAKRWRCPEAGKFYGWLQNRQDEVKVDVWPAVRRAAEKARYAADTKEWDDHVTERAWRLAVRLFEKNKVVIPTEPQPDGKEVNNYHVDQTQDDLLGHSGRRRRPEVTGDAHPDNAAPPIKVYHINQAVAFLNDDGEEVRGTVSDQKWDGDRVSKYQVKIKTGEHTIKTMVDADYVWGLNAQELGV